MPTLLELNDCSTAGTLERVNYFPRQLLTVDDMVTERDYFLAKMRRHNRFLHGWGVVCGLNVTWAGAPHASTEVQIDSGYALGPYGDEIYVPEPVFLDLAKCGTGASTDPCEPDRVSSATGVSGVGATVYVAIKYAECMARPVRAMPAGCACDDDCEYSRIRDSFQLGCLDQPPDSPDPPPFCDIYAGSRVVPCSPCLSNPWVVLAKVVVPLASGSSVSPPDTSVRRIVVSSAILQQQLIDCCCNGKTVTKPVPVQVTIDPPDKTTFGNLSGSTQLPSPFVITFKFSDDLANPEVLNSGAIRVGRSMNEVANPAFDGQYSSYASRTITFIPDSSAIAQIVSGGDFIITVDGTTANQRVVGSNGLALDGSRTGIEGSDAKSHFTFDFEIS